MASGSSDTIHEDIQITAKEKELKVQFVSPWKTSFPYIGGMRPFDFSYEVILTLYTITKGQEEPVLQPAIFAISSLKGEGNCLQQIPNISMDIIWA